MVRVELPAAQLFQPGGVAMQSTAGALLDSVAAELARSYPDQIIGVEGHTEGDAVGGAGWATNQQLSVSRALAVYQYLATRGPLKPQALFTVGHGGNHPVVSNATPDGRSRNNRIELVVYPDKYSRARSRSLAAACDRRQGGPPGGSEFAIANPPGRRVSGERIRAAGTYTPARPIYNGSPPPLPAESCPSEPSI